MPGFVCSSEVPEAGEFHRQATCTHELEKPKTTEEVVNGVLVKVTRVSCRKCGKLVAETLEVVV